MTLEWLAGFFDGEGCVLLSPCRPKAGGVVYYSARLTLTQKDRKILETIQEQYGGRLRRKGAGHSCSFLDWFGPEAIALAKRLEKVCLCKRDQLTVLINSVALPSKMRRQSFETLKQLKRL